MTLGRVWAQPTRPPIHATRSTRSGSPPQQACARASGPTAGGAGEADEEVALVVRGVAHAGCHWACRRLLIADGTLPRPKWLLTGIGYPERVGVERLLGLPQLSRHRPSPRRRRAAAVLSHFWRLHRWRRYLGSYLRSDADLMLRWQGFVIIPVIRGGRSIHRRTERDLLGRGRPGYQPRALAGPVGRLRPARGQSQRADAPGAADPGRSVGQDHHHGPFCVAKAARLDRRRQKSPPGPRGGPPGAPPPRRQESPRGVARSPRLGGPVTEFRAEAVPRPASRVAATAPSPDRRRKARSRLPPNSPRCRAEDGTGRPRPQLLPLIGQVKDDRRDERDDGHPAHQTLPLTQPRRQPATRASLEASTRWSGQKGADVPHLPTAAEGIGAIGPVNAAAHPSAAGEGNGRSGSRPP